VQCLTDHSLETEFLKELKDMHIFNRFSHIHWKFTFFLISKFPKLSIHHEILFRTDHRKLSFLNSAQAICL